MTYMRINGFDTSTIPDCYLLDIGEVQNAKPRRSQSTTIYGANGRLDVTDGAYDGYDEKFVFVTKKLEDVEKIVEKFNFSFNEIEFWYQPGSFRYCDYIGSSYKPKGMHSWELTIEVYVHPFRYQKMVADQIILGNGNVNNEGTVYSEPIIVIEGGGDVTLTIADQTMALRLDSRATIDCRHLRQNIYDKDGNVKNTIRKRGPFFKIPVGTSGISTSGTVSRITIKGNWRYVV